MVNLVSRISSYFKPIKTSRKETANTVDFDSESVYPDRVLNTRIESTNHLQKVNGTTKKSVDITV